MRGVTRSSHLEGRLRWLVGALALVAGACGSAPPTSPTTGTPPGSSAPCVPSPGATCTGSNGWIQYAVGDLPVVVSVPHGGTVEPAGIPTRTAGTTVTDVNTIELAVAIADAFRSATGGSPHLVICYLRRTKLDANREVGEAAQGQPAMVQAWTEYHEFIELAIAEATRTTGSAFFIDLHGHGHAIPRIEWGYLLSASTLDLDDATLDNGGAGAASSLRGLLDSTPDGFSAVLRGPHSLGGLLEPDVASVPSPSAPSPGGAPYFDGGYTTARHAALAPGAQLEAHYAGVRDSPANRAAVAARLVTALRAFMARHLGVMPTEVPRAN